MSPNESATRAGAGQPRPEQVFFQDPAIDRMMGVVLALATEHAVLRNQVQALKAALAKAGVVDAQELDNPDGGLGADEQEEIAAFAEALMRPLMGLQQAAGATGTFSLAKNSGGRDGE